MRISQDQETGLWRDRPSGEPKFQTREEAINSWKRNKIQQISKTIEQIRKTRKL